MILSHGSIPKYIEPSRLDRHKQVSPMVSQDAIVERDQLERSKAIQRRTGLTFYIATRLFPERIRHATYVLYAFLRTVDDLVDDPDPPPPGVQRRLLDRMRREALGEREPSDSILKAFQEVHERYAISDREVEKFIASMEQDVSTVRYATYEELEDYLRGTCVAPAYMMLSIAEPADVEAVRPHMKALGEAFQLTNILRDVREDVLEYGRIYLPRSTLERHGVNEGDIERLEFTDGFAAVIRTEMERTEQLYWRGVDGIELLPDDCQFPVLIAAVLYADHHRLIREQDYDVLSHRPTLSLTRRIRLLAWTWWYWRRTGEPRAAFEAASALGPREPESKREAADVSG
jgi:phytoene synthase